MTYNGNETIFYENEFVFLIYFLPEKKRIKTHLVSLNILKDCCSELNNKFLKQDFSLRIFLKLDALRLVQLLQIFQQEKMHWT